MLTAEQKDKIDGCEIKVRQLKSLLDTEFTMLENLRYTAGSTVEVENLARGIQEVRVQIKEVAATIFHKYNVEFNAFYKRFPIAVVTLMAQRNLYKKYYNIAPIARKAYEWSQFAEHTAKELWGKVTLAKDRYYEIVATQRATGQVDDSLLSEMKDIESFLFEKLDGLEEGSTLYMQIYHVYHSLLQLWEKIEVKSRPTTILAELLELEVEQDILEEVVINNFERQVRVWI